ncbi:MAG: pyruvate dehydrogenase (acetyl-transferring) E1 component subunit alpha [Polyangia bacterium]|jgi:pyruvate dehydrogenase E1 component alpha subunit|nr:pyruvate dehydrogenase (acetyl-transferring) E1 component subunit alpha [Polyangia bacterium]
MPTTELGTFSVSSMQILDEEGRLDESLEPELTDEQRLGLYRGMLLAREVDQRMLKLQRQGRLGTFAPSTGQEASSCGAALAMRESDWFVPSFREFPGALMRGAPIEATLLYHNGYEEGNVFDGSPRTLPVAVIVGSQLLHAVGLGHAMKQKGEDSAVVTFFGDGATSQGDFHEALNFASVWQAPVVFFCQNNQWAISLPRDKQTRSRTLAQKAIAYEMPGVQVDGNDALAVYRATKEALDRARSGGGPTLIEAVTYRLMMHTTADDPTKYRTEEEVQAWWRKDPLVRYRRYLESRGLWDGGRQEALEAEIRAEVEAAVKRFEERKDFKIDEPFDHVFGARDQGIEAQRRAFLDRIEAEASRA